MHLEVLVEEPSAEAALNILIPKILPPGHSWFIHAFNGKAQLLRKLPERLAGYRDWLPDDFRIVVLVDADRDDCRHLKLRLEEMAAAAGLRTRASAGDDSIQVLNRIAVEELEAWFFGDTKALSLAYPRVPSSTGMRATYRHPDRIRGGTWERLERVLQNAGYHAGGLQKIGAAREIANHMDPDRNTSPSFRTFRDGLRLLVSG